MARLRANIIRKGLRSLQYRLFGSQNVGGVYHAGVNATTQKYTGYPTNVVEFKTISSSARYHPNEKPEALLRYLIRTYTDAGDMVLDNTMGSGSTCVAAAIEGRRYIGIERDDKYYGIACARVAEAERQVRIDTEAT